MRPHAGGARNYKILMAGRNVERLRWIGEFDVFLGKNRDELEIDGLLNVHIEIEVSRQDIIDDLVLVGGIAKGQQVGAVEADVFLGGDNGADVIRDLF